jgi:hypothetical protein
MVRGRTRKRIIANVRFQAAKKRAGKATGGGVVKFLRTAPESAPLNRAPSESAKPTKPANLDPGHGPVVPILASFQFFA